MYSVVLMMALSAGADTPAWGGHRHGCDGGCYGGCNGGGCWGGGCYGGGCNGGGDCCGCHGRRLRRHRCHGCDGGCSGGHGCWSGYTCGGGCHGGGGCYGGGGCWGGAMGGCEGGHPMMAPPPPPPGKGPAPQGERLKAAPKPATEEASLTKPATLIVSLPADAALQVDGAVTTATTAVRVFASPALQPGKSYYYTLTAEVVRNGRTLETSQRAIVRAGQVTRTQLEFPAVSVAQR
jgi:uncharacterized protein (TIGR03000 family)